MCAPKGALSVKVVIVISYVLFTYLTAQAQETVDVSKITCDEYLGYKIANPYNISSWLSGYYNAKRNNTIIDVQELEANTFKLENYCIVHSGTPVMRAVEEILGGRK
jgi:acid stress chaperone HdeB